MEFYPGFEQTPKRKYNKRKENIKRLDINEREVKNGDVINLHQTVNGQNLFIVMNVEPLDIRYAHDLNYKYQYDQEELFKPCKYTGETEYEIIANIYNLIPDVSF